MSRGRTLYHVVPYVLGWRVLTDEAIWTHASRDDARVRAIAHARNQWEMCRRPSGVRVHRDAGLEPERIDFGELAVE
jgi:hypothetical protein